MHFWRGKKVLVTGHTGFKGSWLSLWLQLLGADVIGLSLEPPSTPNLFTSANIATDMTSIIGDIRDLSLVQQVFTKHKPEIVIHMAAQALVRYSYHNPVETFATNVMGSVHVLEASRQTDSVKSIVNVTTDKCYENQEWEWGYRENDALGGFDPYSNSKACSELVTSAYRTSYLNSSNIGLASARAGNVIGGGDWAEDRLIPDMIRSFMAGQPVFIRHPNAIRPWQHVLEPLSGYLLLAENLYHAPKDYAGGWNFGPNDQDVRSVSWIADFMVTNWVEGASWKLLDEPQLHEANYLKLDCSKVRHRLGWKPQWDLAQSLQETIDWYQAYQAGCNMRDTTIEQIRQHMSAAKIFMEPNSIKSNLERML